MIPFTLTLHRLKLRARLGVFDWERAEIREFLTDVEATVRADNAIRQDDLSATVNYEQLESLLLEHAAAQEWQLVERLIESLAEVALTQFPMLADITLTLHKPQALQECDVSVKYSRTRH